MAKQLREKVLAALKNDIHFDRAAFAEKHECSRTYVSDLVGQIKRSTDFKDFQAFKKSKPGSREEYKQSAQIIEEIDGIQIETKGKEIRTAEGAMEYCGVNPDEWKITKKVVNFWDMGKNRNWQVKVWLDPVKDIDIEEVMARMVKRLPKFKYSKAKPLSVKKSSVKNSGNLAIIANMDAHIGKLAWDVETGKGDYDINIAAEDYNHVTETNLERVKMFNPEKIIFILGQDIMHTENFEGVTPKGRNVLDVDGRLPKLIDAAIDITINSILKCRAIAPTEVILVQGNHDQTSSIWLAKHMKAWFRDDEYVTVDDQPKLRKARLWGESFIGLSHEILPSKMPYHVGEFSVEFKELWAKANYRECLFGHKHKKSEWKVGSMATHGNMLFRQLTALSPIDFWHYENMFTDAVPGGEALVYNKKTGMIANFTEWTYHTK